MNTNEQAHSTATGALCMDFPGQVNLISVPMERYEMLVRAEAERDILFHAYRNMDKFDLEHVMDAVFNPKFKYEPGDIE